VCEYPQSGEVIHGREICKRFVAITPQTIGVVVRADRREDGVDAGTLSLAARFVPREPRNSRF